MKKFLAVILPLVAAGFLLASWMRMTPESRTVAAKADQWEAIEAARIDREWRNGLGKLPAAAGQADKLEAWVARDAKKLSSEQRKAHSKELATLLTPDGMAQYKALRDERTQDRQALRARKERRLISMLGEAEYRRHLENSKRRSEMKKARREAARAASAPAPAGAK